MRRTLIFLAVGLGINIAVSWGLAAWLPQENWPTEDLSGKVKPNNTFALFLTNYHTVGACRRAWNRTYFVEGSFFQPFYSRILSSHEINDIADDRPLRGMRWGRAEAVRSAPEDFGDNGCEHATGWPVLTAWCEWSFAWEARPPEYVLEGGILVSRPTPGGLLTLDAAELRALPLRPIWIGLAANSIFYAAISCGLWQGTLAIRKTLRRARGQCVGCSYNLAGLPTSSPCPECGLARGVDGVTT